MRYTLPARQEQPLQEKSFSVLSTSRPDPRSFPRTVEVVVITIRGGTAQNRFERRLATSPPPASRGRQQQVVSELFEILQNSVIASFDLVRDTEILNFTLTSHGFDTLGNETLSVRRLSQSLLPDLSRYDIETIANHFNVRVLDPMTAAATADTVADILIELLRVADAMEIFSMEGLKELRNSSLDTVDWRRYAFDRTFIQHLPPCPGVYMMKDRREMVIYVGKAISLRERVATYFTGKEEERVSGLRDSVFDFEFEQTGTALTALLREAELIFALKPQFNTVLASANSSKLSARRARFREASEKSTSGWGKLLILPAVSIKEIDLVLLTGGKPLWRGKLEADLSNIKQILDDLQRFLSTPVDACHDPEEEQKKSIVENWLSRNEDLVNLVEVDGSENSASIEKKIRPFVESGDWHSGKVIYRM